MVTTTSALRAFLATNAPFFGAELYTFTLLDGTILRVTSFDQSITYAGHTYTALGPYIGRSKLSVGTKLKASSITITIAADPTMMIESQSILLALAQGKFANAAVTVRRAFMPTPGDTNLGGAGDGTIMRFSGTVGTVSGITAVAADIEVRGISFMLNRPLPKNAYQPGCWHTLFDAGCTISKGSFQVSGTVGAGSTNIAVKTGKTNDASIPGSPVSAPTLALVSSAYSLPWIGYYVFVTYTSAYGETTASPQSFLGASPGHVIQVTSPPSVTGATGWNVYIGDGAGNEQLQNTSPIAIGTNYTSPDTGINQSGILPPAIPSTGYWALGQITFTSGALSGLTAAITGSAADGTVALAAPLPSAPLAGVTYTMVPGCDKTAPTCNDKFSNIVHFTGFPAIPTPEVGG